MQSSKKEITPFEIVETCILTAIPYELPSLELVDRKIEDRGNIQIFYLDSRACSDLARIKKNNVSIKSITLIFAAKLLDLKQVISPVRYIYEENFLLIQTEQSVYSYRLVNQAWSKDINETCFHLTQSMLELGALIEGAFLQLQAAENLLKKYGFSTFKDVVAMLQQCDMQSTGQEQSLYKTWHGNLVKYVDKHIKPEEQKINLISLGCGEAKDLEVLVQALGSRVNMVIGMDASKVFIERAKKRFVKTKNSIFINGDCLDFDKLLPHFRGFTVGIAVGFLSRGIISGTKDALLILQKVLRQSIDLFAITGIYCLVTKEIAKAVGFEPQTYTETATSSHGKPPFQFPIYILKKQTSDDYAKRFYAEINFLDLSMCANPLEVLKALPDGIKKKVEIIDLSFAYITKEEISLLALVLIEFPEHMAIIHDPQDSWAPELKKQAKIKCLIAAINRRHNFIWDIPPYTYAYELAITKNFTNLYARLAAAKFGLGSRQTAYVGTLLKDCKSTLFPELAEIKEEAQAYYNMGLDLYKRNEFDAAIECLLKAVNLYQKEPKLKKSLVKTYSELATVYQAINRPQKALEFLTFCVTLYTGMSLDLKTPEMAEIMHKIDSVLDQIANRHSYKLS